MSNVELAKKIGYSKQTITNIAKGRVGISMNKMLDICQTYKISIQKLSCLEGMDMIEYLKKKVK